MISEADPELCERDPQRVVRHEVDQVLALVALAGASELRHDAACSSHRCGPGAVARGCPPSPIVVHLGRRWLARRQHAREQRSQLVGGCAELGAGRRDVRRRRARNWRRAFERAGVATSCSAACPFVEWAAVFEAGRARRDGRHRCDARRKRDAKADGRRVRTRYFRLNSQEWSPYRVPNVLATQAGRTMRRRSRSSRDRDRRGVAAL